MAVYTQVDGVTVVVKTAHDDYPDKSTHVVVYMDGGKECSITDARWQRTDGPAPANAVEGTLMPLDDYNLKKQADFDTARDIINGFFTGMTQQQRADLQKALARHETADRLKHVIDTNLEKFLPKRKK